MTKPHGLKGSELAMIGASILLGWLLAIAAYEAGLMGSTLRTQLLIVGGAMASAVLLCGVALHLRWKEAARSSPPSQREERGGGEQQHRA